MSEPARLTITERDAPDRLACFAVRLQPRASGAGISGLRANSLKVRVHAPPVEGAANAAVIDVIAAAPGVARREVHIVGGLASRSKVVEVSGLSAADVHQRLGL